MTGHYTVDWWGHESWPWRKALRWFNFLAIKQLSNVTLNSQIRKRWRRQKYQKQRISLVSTHFFYSLQLNLIVMKSSSWLFSDPFQHCVISPVCFSGIIFFFSSVFQQRTLNLPQQEINTSLCLATTVKWVNLRIQDLSLRWPPSRPSLAHLVLYLGRTTGRFLWKTLALRLKGPGGWVSLIKVPFPNGLIMIQVFQRAFGFCPLPLRAFVSTHHHMSCFLPHPHQRPWACIWIVTLENFPSIMCQRKVSLVV